MTIRARTLITIGATLLGLIIVLFIGAYLILVRSLVQFEEQRTRGDLMRIRETLSSEMHNLGSLASAWALLDQTASSGQLHPAAFPGITAASQRTQRVNVVVCFTPAGTVAFSSRLHAATAAGAPLAPEALRAFAARADWFCRDTDQARQGLLLLPDGIVLVAASPVIARDRQGTRLGTLVLGREIDQQMITHLEQSTRLQINLFRTDERTQPWDICAALAQADPVRQYHITTLNDQDIAGYLFINDITGQRALALRILLLRGVYSHGLSGVRYFLLSLLLIGVVSSVLVMVLLEKLVLARLARVSAEVNRLGQTGDLSARLDVHGNDELSRLSTAVNGMLSSLAVSQAELRKKETLRESEERYRSLVELSPDAVYILRNEQFVFANASGVALLGAGSPEDLIGQPLLGAIQPEHRESVERRLLRLADGQEWTPTEERVVRVDGTVVDVELAAVPFTYQGHPAIQVVARDITERKRDRERLNYLAYFDPLTGLPNRQLFNDRLAQVLALAHRRTEHVTVMVLDLDRFKEINDALGHHVGDCLLQSVATRLKGCVRESDTIARIGGDEFFLILPNTGGRQSMEPVARKILNTFADPFVLDTDEIYITASLGISHYPEDGTTIDTLVKNADTAMYRAKAAGRNASMSYAPEMGAVVTERRTLEHKLRKALEHDELAVFYQPKVDLQTCQVTGMEALARWQSPELGMVPPMLFIPLAEETGLIEPLGELVLRKACQQNRRYQLAGSQLRLAVNLSVVQFQQPTLVESITRVLQETALPPHLLELEITESVAMQNIEHTLSVLRSLNDLGVSIAIDDFGTGYSSFSYLTKFPIHTLKIDRSFIQDLLHDQDDAAIVAAIIAMTHSLRRRVVAEAVETEAQLTFLRDHDCDEAQGYYFGKPVPSEDFLPLVDRINRPLCLS